MAQLMGARVAIVAQFKLYAYPIEISTYGTPYKIRFGWSEGITHKKSRFDTWESALRALERINPPK